MLAVQSNLNVSVGADIRLRYDGTDNLQTPSREGSVPSDYARIRMRPWIKAEHQGIGMLVRMADEFRAYRAPDSLSRRQHWPDVLFIDNMYFEWKGAFGAFDFKLGRQDMAFGAKRIVSEGTGGDGSGTTHIFTSYQPSPAVKARSEAAEAIVWTKAKRGGRTSGFPGGR